MKKILLLFAAMCCMMVANAQEFTENGIRYNVTSEEDKTVEVVADDYSGDVKVPATVTNEGVTYSVTSIGEGAFFKCTGLTSITLPEGLKTIGSKAFYYCCDMTSAILPEGLESIGDAAFDDCFHLKSLTIPSTVKSIGAGAFDYCESLTSLTLPEGLESIGSEAFNYCGNLKSIIIPSTVKSIGECLFSSCYLLTSISVAEGNTVYDSRDNCNAIIETATNTLINGCNNAVIPSSVTAIADWAFFGCHYLTSITIPNGVTKIGTEAFSNCDYLTSVIIPSTVAEIGNYAFSYCSLFTSVTLPEGLESIGSHAFYFCSGLKYITVLALTPPTLADNDVFFSVDKSIPVYVPDVDAYSGWGRFTNIQSIDLEKIKQSAIDEIKAAKEGVVLTADENVALDACITTINSVETLSDKNLATIEKAKNEAMAIIGRAKVRTVREEAFALIEVAMQGETSDYLTGLILPYIDMINSATDVDAIYYAGSEALEILHTAVRAYKAGKNNAVGSLGEKQNGPALIVTDQDDKKIIFYSPKRVEYIKKDDK